MDQTSLRSLSRTAHRSLIAISVVALLGTTISAGGCSNQFENPPATWTPDGAAIGSGGTAGFGVQTSTVSTVTTTSSATSNAANAVGMSTVGTTTVGTSTVGI